MDTFPTPVYYHHLDLPGGDPPHSVATVLKRKFENWHIKKVKGQGDYSAHKSSIISR